MVMYTSYQSHYGPEGLPAPSIRLTLTLHAGKIERTPDEGRAYVPCGVFMRSESITTQGRYSRLAGKPSSTVVPTPSAESSDNESPILSQSRLQR